MVKQLLNTQLLNTQLLNTQLLNTGSHIMFSHVFFLWPMHNCTTSWKLCHACPPSLARRGPSHGPDQSVPAIATFIQGQNTKWFPKITKYIKKTKGQDVAEYLAFEHDTSISLNIIQLRQSTSTISSCTTIVGHLSLLAQLLELSLLRSWFQPDRPVMEISWEFMGYDGHGNI